MADRLKKIGYFCIRHCGGEASDQYVSFADFKEWDEGRKQSFKEKYDAGTIQLFCACCTEHDLPLSITSSHVIRVVNNNQQDFHMESCPKSISYAGWVSQNKGVTATEDLDYMYSISFPTLVKSSSKSSSSSGTGSGMPREKKTPITDLAIAVNRIAWQKQTFSIKKKIKEAHKNGSSPDWEFKDLTDFNRLFFGVSNEILVKCEGTVLPLALLAYNSTLFYQCNDYRRQWFVYAVIDKISEYKSSRKYQYVTVCMPSKTSKSKATVRVLTEDFDTLFNSEVMDDAFGKNTSMVLTGFITRSVFKGADGTVNEWMTLTRGRVIRVNQYGLYVENPLAAAVSSFLCKKHLIFTAPHIPLENFGNLMPSFEIERKKDKNILIDCPNPEDYEAHVVFGQNNEEYNCVIAKNMTDVVNFLSSMTK